ncbi:hypothetical protein PHACT_02635 [Pseudohongiella acticola]|uniref:Sel1 repeat family protein n=1 Tax=Pseudohongiella acticola TaxID=1524254 RepID=A0A1E8CID4_9GAMM|nr:tetratricopeptide repeat protein [Pseudohongiella acticola]OFE12164.1 hypothetical protein PHACT_02635 [Pseudohongiella acticola]
MTLADSWRRLSRVAVCLLWLLAIPAMAADATAPSPAAITSLTNLAESGDPDAQFSLANRYLEGNGVEQDNFAALRWFTRAAENGNANAQYNIAVMYLNGIGVVRDPEQAVTWFVRAAENGDPPSQYTLAVLLFNGQLGVPQNVPQAYKWFTLAGTAGVKEAAANAVLVQELLPANEVEAMQAEARQWIDTFNQRQNNETATDFDSPETP